MPLGIDRPLAQARSAERLLWVALREKDAQERNHLTRAAMYLSWIAACSAADVAAERFNLPVARGYNGRCAIYTVLGDLLNDRGLAEQFSYLKTALHDAAREDRIDPGVAGIMAEVTALVERVGHIDPLPRS
jgi:hypothetical protein